MTTTAHEDQFTAGTQTIQPVLQPYSTEAILRRNIADMEVALKQQTERAEAAEAELARMAQQKPVAWMDAEGDTYKEEPPENWCPPHVPLYAAANPAAILALIAEIDSLRDEVNGLTGSLDHAEKALKESRANDMAAMAWLADCRIASGDHGKRMLPEFVEYLREMKRQRDELLVAIKDAHQVLRDWGAYIPSSTIQEDLEMLGIAIANAEKTT